MQHYVLLVAPTRRRPTRGVRSPMISLPRREPGLELAWLVGNTPDPNQPSLDAAAIKRFIPDDFVYLSLRPQPECANRGVLPETQQERARGGGTSPTTPYHQ